MRLNKTLLKQYEKRYLDIFNDIYKNGSYRKMTDEELKYLFFEMMSVSGGYFSWQKIT